MKKGCFLEQDRQQMDHSYFAPIFKIQIVKKIKAAIGFFCAQ